MGRERAIAASEGLEPVGNQREMERFLFRDNCPVVEERPGKTGRGKARNQIAGEVDRVELDMRQRVEEGNPPRRAARLAGCVPLL